MSTVQWMFHYFEIMKFNRDEKRIFIESLDDISTSIQAFYLLVDKDRGPKLIDTIADMRKKRADNSQATKSQSASNNQEDDAPDLLSGDDKELWSFMESLPETMVAGEGMTEERKPILPTRSKADIIKSQTKVIDKLEGDNKPKLGIQ